MRRAPGRRPAGPAPPASARSREWHRLGTCASPTRPRRPRATPARTVTCSPASDRTSAGRRRGAARALRRDDRQRRLLAAGHGVAVALRDRPGRRRPGRRPSTSRTSVPAHGHDAHDGGLVEVGDELLRRGAAVGVPHRQRQLVAAAVGAEEEPEEQRERQRHDEDEDERQPVARRLQQVLAGEERGEPHANRLLIRSTAKKKKATANPSGTSSCQRMSPTPPPRIAVSQPWSSQPLGVSFWTMA